MAGVGDHPDRVTLTRGSPLLSLTEHGAAMGSLRVSLTWSMRQAAVEQRERRLGASLRPSRLFKPIEAESPSSVAMVTVDLDLGCMYELEDGTKGVAQPLGGLFGDFDRPPYVQLSGDDRFGSSGETMYINLDMHDRIRRMLIFAYIYDGTPAFDRAKAVVTLYPYVGPRIEVHLDERAPEARSCAVAMVEKHNGELMVRREVRYVYGFQAELDRLYGWGLEWARGYKDRI
ncbi:Tellurium resistance [Mangrovactinospora gilvigrisea]|nr:Tellurium resistance [Mangrovactinospora gilvigrisea]